jgi:hypothetical protein
MSISPNNEFLAVAGGGLEFFKFNGAEPITYLAGPFYGSGGASINGIAWDNNNHLLAVSAFGDMYVETVTETGATPAPGSPYPNDGAAGYYGGYSISVVPVAK